MKKQKSIFITVLFLSFSFFCLVIDAEAQEIQKKNTNVWQGTGTPTITLGKAWISDGIDTSSANNRKFTVHNRFNGFNAVFHSIPEGSVRSQGNVRVITNVQKNDYNELYGIYNSLYSKKSLVSTYGIFNEVISENTDKPTYGIYTSLVGERNNSSYGIYSEVNTGGWAGYFVGNGFFSGSLRVESSLSLGIDGVNSISLLLNKSGDISNLTFGGWFQMRSNGSFEFGSTNNKFTLGTSAEGSLKVLTFTPGNQKFYSDGSINFGSVNNVFSLKTASEGSLKVLTFTPGNQKLFSDGSGLFAGGLKFSTATAGLEIKEITYKGAPALRINRKNLPSEKNFTFLSNGNFEVDGKIFAREVEVMLPPFPDYVFGENYTLMPIEQVEGFIKENGHLPNVPSASSIEENGIGLGQLSVIQMEKIEELTLYLIQLNNRVKQLEQENKELRAVVKAVE